MQLFSLLLHTAVFTGLVAGLDGRHPHAKFHHEANEIGGYSQPYGGMNGLQRGYRSVAYYVNWAIYARNHPPQDIPVSRLTHVNYAFMGINNITSEVILTDEFADVQKMWPGDMATDFTNSNNATHQPMTNGASMDMEMFGNLKQLYLHKKHNRHLKTMMSIGGWSLRKAFAPALATDSGRKNFAKTAVQLIKDLGFDGVEIDYEYPSSAQEAADLVSVCQLIREELDSYSRSLNGNPHFLLALAVPAGPINYVHFDVPGFKPYVDFIQLMAYDYQGSVFSNYSGHDANVYKSRDNPRSTDFETEDPLRYYLNAGMPAEGITLGMPLYGRSFANTSGPGMTYTNATDGTWEPAVWDYKAMPQNGSQVYTDNTIVASWCYNKETRYMVSYDTPEIAVQKTHYLVGKGLGGAMWWETSGDFKVDDQRSLIRTVTTELGHFGGMETSMNVLDYPQSKYRNLREGMPGQ
ncbi:glycoside hydrolase family 18 like protein [Zymoseptoria brevis]|uniref:chitinase n=1 Tax=Zymoseptoria brevis TaxID=1047168 RepID=A0A0F4GXS6_9PEZI|nr:glycoside hydrolase family 18 like protein [Zymoseptoria brevis]